MSKHTPEQWEAQNTAGHEIHGQAAVYDATGKDVAIVYDGEAHATLIAEAPALLAALRRIANSETRSDRRGRNNAPMVGIEIVQSLQRTARVAIAKVEGEATMRGRG